MSESKALTLHFQVSRRLGVGGAEGHLACLRHFAVVQDQSVFGPVLHDLNVLQGAAKTSAFHSKHERYRKSQRSNLEFDSLSQVKLISDRTLCYVASYSWPVCHLKCLKTRRVCEDLTGVQMKVDRTTKYLLTEI